MSRSISGLAGLGAALGAYASLNVIADGLFDYPPPDRWLYAPTKKRPANAKKKAARKRQRRARAITRAHR